MKPKFIFLLVVFLLSFSVASAYINAKMDVLPPKNVDVLETCTIFGYIESDSEIEKEDIKLEIYGENGILLQKFNPEFGTRNGNDADKNVFFYANLIAANSGEYTVKLLVNDDKKESENIKVKDINEREVEITSVDYDIYESRIKFEFSIKNNKNVDDEITVYLKSENNWDNPLKFQTKVKAGKEKTITKEYSISTFGSGNFIIAVYAKNNDGNAESYSSPKIIIVESEDEEDGYNDDYETYSYGYGEINIIDIVILNPVFYASDAVEADVKIRNPTSKEVQYNFEFVLDNQLFRKGDVSYIQPYSTKNERVVFEVPDKETFKIVAKVYSPYLVDSFEKIFMVSQRYRLFIPILSEVLKVVNAGEKTAVNLTIKNAGNQDDIYKILVDGWEKYNLSKEAIIKAGEQKTIEIVFDTEKEMNVGTYPVNIKICNILNSCIVKNLEITVTKPESEQSNVLMEGKELQYFEKDEKITYTLTVANKENLEKDYSVEVKADNAKINISEERFSLAKSQAKNVTVEVTPEKDENLNLTIGLIADGEKIFEKQFMLVYTKNKALAMTGFSIFGTEKMYLPAVYILATIVLLLIIFVGTRVAIKLYKNSRIKRYMQAKALRQQQVTPLNFQNLNNQYSVQQTQSNMRKQMPQYPTDSFLKNT